MLRDLSFTPRLSCFFGSVGQFLALGSLRCLLNDAAAGWLVFLRHNLGFEGSEMGVAGGLIRFSESPSLRCL